MLTGGKNVIPHAVRDVADAAAAFSARIGPDRHFDSQKDVEEALEECCTPQNVTVIGLTGSGKSSTLDALAGEYFCSRVSSEATLIRWQYKPNPAPHTHEWVEDRFYPSDSLLNLEFWDTIGLEQPAAPQRLKHIVPKSDAVLAFLPVYDNLERALKQETADEAYKKGVEMTLTELVKILDALGVKPFGEAGETFDPQRHNAVMHIEDESLGENVIAEVFQTGFAHGDKVIRFAMVKVAN